MNTFLLLCFVFQGATFEPGMQDRIRAIQSHEDFAALIKEHRQLVSERVEELWIAETLPAGVDRSENSLYIQGKHAPELLYLPGLINSAIGHFQSHGNDWTVNELLKRGFPTSALGSLKELLSRKPGEPIISHYERLFKSKYMSLYPENANDEPDQWLVRIPLPEGDLYITDREQLRRYLQFREDAGGEADDLEIIEKFAHMQPQAMRVILSFAYEVIAPISFNPYRPGRIPDSSVDYYLEVFGE